MSESDELPRMLGGRYRLESTLGHGGMGVVYRGTDFMMKRAVAIKLVRAEGGGELDDETAGRFLREAKNTARLQHEHIIEIFDLGRSEDGLYFVMELLAGESLSAKMKREGPFSPQKTVHIARQICDALEVAHAAGVVHRDLKPANVMLISRAGDQDFVKVLDFGVSKSFTGDQDATQLTHTGMLVGTVDYMAPEQITGKRLDGRADVYALGIVLYKMLSGKAPFRDTGVPALIHAHLNTMPRPLIETVPGVPNALDHVVLRCLAKAPDRRFDSMAELARALAGAIEPVGGDDEDEDEKKTRIANPSRRPRAFDADEETLLVARTPNDVGRVTPDSKAPPPNRSRPASQAPPSMGPPVQPATARRAPPAQPATVRHGAGRDGRAAISNPPPRMPSHAPVTPGSPGVPAPMRAPGGGSGRPPMHAPVTPGSPGVPAPMHAPVTPGAPGIPAVMSGSMPPPMPRPHPSMPPPHPAHAASMPPYMGQPPSMPPQPPYGAPPPAPPPPASRWHRFLVWTGIRNR